MANVFAALAVFQKFSALKIELPVFADDNKKYLSTDLVREERAYADYLAPEVELLAHEAIKRVCYTCFEGNA